MVHAARTCVRVNCSRCANGGSKLLAKQAGGCQIERDEERDHNSPQQELPVTQRHCMTHRSQVTPAGSTKEAYTSDAVWSARVK